MRFLSGTASPKPFHDLFTKERRMGIPPALFICLFFAGLGIFFIGVALLWWVSLQARAMKDGQNVRGLHSVGSS